MLACPAHSMTIPESERAALHARYWQHRSTLRLALLGVLASTALALIFRNHRAWGDGELAYAAYAAAHVAGVLCALTAFRANGFMHEARGLYIGRFGSPPANSPPVK